MPILCPRQPHLGHNFSETVRETAWRYLRKHFHSIYGKHQAEAVLYELQRRFTEPEGWRALRAYVPYIVKLLGISTPTRNNTRPLPRSEDEDAEDRDGLENVVAPRDQYDDELPEMQTVMRSADADDMPTAGDYRRMSERYNKVLGDDHPARYSIQEVFVRLPGADSPISIDSLYDWIHRGNVLAHREFRRFWLDETGLAKARLLAQERYARRYLKKVLTEKDEKSEAAAKKHVQRLLKAGKPLLEEVRKRIPNFP